jgi:glycosyltransferase involved in cell wall biosynthesis
MERITVAQIVSSLDAGGGVQWMSYELARHLDPARYRAIVCCLYQRGELAERLEAQGIPVFVLRGKSSSNPLYLGQNLGTVWQLRNLLRSQRVQIAHAHEFYSGTLGRVAARLAGTPVTILMLHNKDRWKRRPHILVDRLLARWTDVIVANSHSVRDYAIPQESLDPLKTAVVHNGISERRFASVSARRQAKRTELGLKSQAPVLTVVGRLAKEKGHRYLIEALPAVRALYADVRLLIVGDDSSLEASTKEDIVQRVKALGLEGSVSLLGQRDDVPDILGATDIFCLPSLWEGFGLVIAEAMAAGRPVVASRIDGIPEVVEDGVTGILVPPRDPRALAEAILELLADPNKAEAMGRAGRERVRKHFTVEAMVLKWDMLYQELARKKGMLI